MVTPSMFNAGGLSGSGPIRRIVVNELTGAAEVKPAVT
jgi:hypothetical protein